MIIALVIQGAFFSAARTQDSDGGPKLFPPNSPEHQALTASTPYLGDEDFYLRNDYWQGSVSPDEGTAMRLQFFKGNTYRLFFGATKDKLPAGSILHLNIFDSNSKEVTAASGEPGEAAAVLSHKNRKTGLYLILMRIEIPDSAKKEGSDSEKNPCVLFYGWK